MEKQVVPIEQKIKWIEQLIFSGVDIIQVGSFVHPTKVPQMADTDALFKFFAEAGRKPENVILSGFVLNEKGLERGLTCNVEMFCMGVSASETHSQKNTGMSVNEATERIITTAKLALNANKKVQVSVQSAFGCGFEGHMQQEKVLEIVKRYLDSGLRNISLADTAGHATPEAVEKMFNEIFKLDSSVECTCHFHNTYGLGLANCYTALKVGVKYFESSVAGLGGCPFTKVASGNICTEDFVHYLQRAGQRTDIKLDVLITIARNISEFFQRELPGLVYKTGPIPTTQRT
jgi:hydroxymethylglutaryl-CoA lyase